MATTNPIGFFSMLHQIYGAVGSLANTVTSLASATTHGANALDNLGMWAEEQTATFVDEARIERQAKILELRAKRLQGVELVNDTSTSVPKLEATVPAATV